MPPTYATINTACSSYCHRGQCPEVVIATAEDDIRCPAETHLHTGCLHTLDLIPYIHTSTHFLLWFPQLKLENTLSYKCSPYSCLVVNSYQGVNSTEQRLYVKITGLSSLF
ncbi:hypothetical protein ECG_07828 [Echinococcus granulosus]|nr:hypothetical protein ECG_07828 [Echinococcus granulosus]